MSDFDDDDFYMDSDTIEDNVSELLVGKQNSWNVLVYVQVFL